jgi:acyl carrier protein
MATEIDSSHLADLPRERVLQAVKEIVGEVMGVKPNNIRESTTLVTDLGCDSLDVTEIVMETEDHFDLTIPSDTDDLPDTIGDIVDGVLQLVGQSGV